MVVKEGMAQGVSPSIYDLQLHVKAREEDWQWFGRKRGLIKMKDAIQISRSGGSYLNTIYSACFGSHFLSGKSGDYEARGFN